MFWTRKRIDKNWTQIKYEFGKRHAAYLEERVKIPTSDKSTERFYTETNRSALYTQTIGGKRGWGQNTLSPTDTNGSRLIKYIEDKLRKKDREEPLTKVQLMVMKKANGVHIMVILERLPGNCFKIVNVIGKQGAFDGVNARTAPFLQIVNALFDKATFKTSDIPESLTHLCLQAELVMAEGISDHVEVCKLVFAYERVENKSSILKKIKLLIFNVCEYERARGMHAEKVNIFSLSTVNAILKEWSQQHYKPEYNATGHCKLYICPRLFIANSFTDEDKDAVAEFYKRHCGGEGFITSFYFEKSDGSNEIEKTKSKPVYSNERSLAFDIDHCCMCVLLPPTGGSPVGIVCFVQGGEMLLYTDFKPFTDPLRGFAYQGSTKWKAADLVSQVFEDLPREGKLKHRQGDATPDGQVLFQVETRSGVVLQYTVPEFLLTRYSLSFVDLSTIDYLGVNNAYAYKCNEIIPTRRGVNLDTPVFMGLILDYDRDFIMDLLEKARGTDILTVSEIIHISAPTFKDLLLSPADYKDLFQRKLTKFHEIPEGRLVEIRPFYKVLEAQRREEARGAVSSPKRAPSQGELKTCAQSSRSPGTSRELQALIMARRELPGVRCLYDLSIFFERVGSVTDKNLGEELAIIMQNDSNISRGDKARITKFYKENLPELKEIAKNEQQEASGACPALQPMIFDDEETQAVVVDDEERQAVVVDNEERQAVVVDNEETQAPDCYMLRTVHFTYDAPPASAGAAGPEPSELRARCLEAAEKRSGIVRERSESPVLRCVVPRTVELPPVPPVQQAPSSSPILTPPSRPVVSARLRFGALLGIPPPPPPEQEEEENWEIGSGIPFFPSALIDAAVEEEEDLHI